MAANQIDDEIIAYREYMNENLNSQSFYVLSEHGSKMTCGITKLEKDRDFALLKKAEEAGRFAIENYNLGLENCDSSSKLKFMKILHVNVEAAAGKNFYITLSAKYDIDDDLKQFQAKVWAKINNVFQVIFFRPAPFTPDIKEEEPYSTSIIRIDNLEDWMDENYLYYMCFYKSPNQILKVKVGHNEETSEHERYGLVEFKRDDAAIRAFEYFDGTLMPHSTRCYKLKWATNEVGN